jgi:hypothetical protein
LGESLAAVQAGMQRWSQTPWPAASAEPGSGAPAYPPGTGWSCWWRRLPEDARTAPLVQPWPPQPALLLEWLSVPD